MKKRILSVVLALAAVIGFNASAQEQCPNASKCDKKEQIKGGRHKAPRYNPFEGITLSEDQKAQFKSLFEEAKKHYAERKDKKECNVDSAKCDKKGDKACKHDAVKGKRGKHHMNKMKAEYLKKVKEILTPDQYVVFLENMVTHQQPAFGPRHHRHDKKGHHQAKCDKQGECDQNCKK